jgi:predicted secreted acid phosphatase
MMQPTKSETNAHWRMRTVRTAVAAAVLCLAGCATEMPSIVWVGHQNLGDLKKELISYKESGAYERELATIDAQAEAFIISRSQEVTRPALVLDVDETSLSNWPEMIANDFGYFPSGSCDDLPKGPCGARAWELSAKDEAVAPTLALFRAARAHGVAVFFISGRTEDERAATELNLHNVGYDSWSGVALRPVGSHNASISDFKMPERVKIEAQGYTIIANVGDQPSDLTGGHAERTFLLSDPFYRIP